MDGWKDQQNKHKDGNWIEGKNSKATTSDESTLNVNDKNDA